MKGNKFARYPVNIKKSANLWLELPKLTIDLFLARNNQIHFMINKITVSVPSQ
ncbi:MAG: hypothetical protein AAB777_01315 [Patescibacteria group bacterium]